jgi:hypothetical protein
MNRPHRGSLDGALHLLLITGGDRSQPAAADLSRPARRRRKRWHWDRRRGEQRRHDELGRNACTGWGA